MKLLFLCGVSYALAFAGTVHNLTDRASLIAQNTSHNLTEPFYNASHNVTGGKTEAQNVSHDRVTPISKVVVVEENVSFVPKQNKTDKALVHNTTEEQNITGKRSLTNIKNMPHNLTQNVTHNVTELNTTQGRKLLQAQTQPVANKTVDEKKMSLLKDYRTDVPKNSSVYNITDRFWQDTKKWALDANQIDCRDLMQKWFDATSSFQTSGLPTSFAMVGNNGAVCKILKQVLTPSSFLWETAFFNDLMSAAMGSLWISGQAVDKSVKLPDQMEMLFQIQFDPVTSKIVALEIVPVDPDLIYQAVATKPVKSYQHFVRTGMQEGLESPKLLKLLSDKFVLEVPNLFVGDTESKTLFHKADLQEFLDQYINVFDLEEAKISSFSIPFHDAKTVVSEISFDELPIKANGIVLQGVKFWIIHTFDCNATTTARKLEAVVNTTGTKTETAAEDTDYCLLDRLIVTVNRPISLLTRLVPFEIQRGNSSQANSSESTKQDDTSK